MTALPTSSTMPQYSWPIGVGWAIGWMPRYGQRSDPQTHAAEILMMASLRWMIFGTIVPRELWDRVQAKLSSDNQGRKNGVAANSSSLLVGLLYDAEGNRFTPSHTLKNRKRYRYYVCQSVIRNPGGTHASPTRLPAHEIESQVSLRIRSFLQSDKDVMDQLTLDGDSPEVTRKLLFAAQNSF